MRAILKTYLGQPQFRSTILALGFACFVAAMPVQASDDVVIGRQTMLPSQNIAYNLARSTDHTILMQALKSAGMVDRLRMKGPYTFFAPTNAAFAKLPEQERQLLLDPSNKTVLAEMLRCHVIPGKYDFSSLERQIRLHHGSVSMMTINCEVLRFEMNGARNIIARDENGRTANIMTYDAAQSNGVINVIDTVLAVKN